MLSADIHLVAFGVAKHVSGIQLSHFLEGKGLYVLSCDLQYEIISLQSDDQITEAWLSPYTVNCKTFTFLFALLIAMMSSVRMNYTNLQLMN